MIQIKFYFWKKSLNTLSYMGGKELDRISRYDINIISSKQEMRIKKNIHYGIISWSDQYQYLGNCPPTPPLTQQQSIDNNLRLILG